jgi:hypothetical protein
MLGDFTFLDLFSERSTVAGAVATRAADFLGAFGHDGILVVVTVLEFRFWRCDCSSMPYIRVTLNLFGLDSRRRSFLTAPQRAKAKGP